MAKFKTYMFFGDESNRTSLEPEIEIYQGDLGRHFARVTVTPPRERKRLGRGEVYELGPKKPDETFEVPLNGPGKSKAIWKVRKDLVGRYDL